MQQMWSKCENRPQPEKRDSKSRAPCALVIASVTAIIVGLENMRTGIRLKLFLTLLAALVTVVLAMVLLMQWSFDRGFHRYVVTVEQERLERLAETLEAVFAETGDWRFLYDAPETWQYLIRQTVPNGGHPARMLRRMPRRDAGCEPPSPRGFDARVFLLDADQHPLAGPPHIRQAASLLPLTVGNRTVGYLGLAPHLRPGDFRQIRFVQEQKRAFLFIGLGLAGAVALLSIPLAHSLVRRIVALADATHRLASGQLDSRIADRSSDELGQLAHDFNTLAKTLEENEHARRQWVADISHELRTPVAILRGEIEALRDGVRTATPEALHSLHDETLRLQRLIDDLHQLSLADIGALSCQREPLDLNPWLREFYAGYAQTLVELGLDATLELPARPLRIHADPQRLRQLLTNLIENTLKYTEAPGQVRLALHHIGTDAVITLCDSAPGVPPAALPHLFERLYRVEDSRNRASGGAGLGLAICQAIAAAHNATLEARPSPLGGLCIELRLPLVQNP